MSHGVDRRGRQKRLADCLTARQAAAASGWCAERSAQPHTPAAGASVPVRASSLTYSVTRTPAISFHPNHKPAGQSLSRPPVPLTLEDGALCAGHKPTVHESVRRPQRRRRDERRMTTTASDMAAVAASCNWSLARDQDSGSRSVRLIVLLMSEAKSLTYAHMCSYY